MRRTGLVAVVLLVTACGGGGSEGGIGSVTPEALAGEAGCASYEPSESSELGVSEQGRCSLDGDPLLINTFSNNEARDTWVEAARNFGGPYFVGDRFVAYSDGNPDTTESLSDSIDGEVVR